MTLHEFLRNMTNVGELCAICEKGWTVATCWIDREDLFQIPQSLADKELKQEEWGKLKIRNYNGNYESISCHYLYI